jgi:hypothetical protein
MRIGDQVWVLCEVVEGPYRGCIECKNGSVCFRPLVSEVKPVEPEAVEQPATSDPSGEWEPTKDEIEYAKDRCGVPASEPLAVGDAVRFVLPRHERHGTEGVVSSKVDLVSSGCNYWFDSNCGQFSCYCTASQLERINQADPVNPSHYKQGPAETIDIIEAAIAKAPSNKAAGLHWQVLKYALRCWFKNGIEDLKKARWYLDRLIKEEEAK